MAHIVAELPGILSLLHVDEGQSVKQGDVVCAIECMKTMYDHKAPCDGTVHYLAKLGDMVGDGESIAEITP